ncbi:MAG TPA: carboxypeptidase-like regulatory domain-containing protein [Gemmatimonadaceae bacterium]
MRRTPVAFALALACAPLVASAAQSVRGIVVGSAGSPVSGVTVLLLDSASATAASAFTDEHGAFLLKATVPGTYRLRTLRLGFRTAVSAPMTLTAGQEVTRRVDVEEIRFLLDTVRVTGRNACRMASDSAVATFAV